MYPSRGIHPELKLKAIALAKKPGGLGRGGTVGASAAAQILNLKEKSVRSVYYILGLASEEEEIGYCSSSIIILYLTSVQVMA